MENVFQFGKIQKICEYRRVSCLSQTLIRLSGAAMKVIWSETQLEQFILEASSVSPDYPIVISKFLEKASEVEVDAIGGTD